ncbi:MAG: alpha/beta hydrolase [Clostridia bacterium]|nr:alpha/beta hydrolase [Clostridia bacterium]MBR2289665.1 alpha/beta hydrolase [Clostridia bacterium]
MTIVNDRTSLPYAIAYTDKIKTDTEMIVETINLSGDKKIMEAEIENTARRLFTISDKAPIVIPLIPQSTPECDVQQLAKECFTEEKGNGQRIDLQVLECIQDAKRFISETTNTRVKEKVFLNGYSASGVFAQRFALIHPEIIHRCCIGGAAGSIPIPNEELGYPLGTKDYKALFGKELDETEYKKIDFAYYVGQGEAHEAGNWDINGNAIRRDKEGRRIDKTQIPAPMHDMSYKGDTTPAEIGKEQREIYGEDLNSRFINSLRYYKENDYNIKAKIYRGIGHKGIFDSRMNPFAGVVMSDIRNFYENGEGFLQDNTSTNRIDMSEQTRREKRNEKRA